MSWVKGDRLKVTLEITAEEPSDETSDIWFRQSFGRTYINEDDIRTGGGSVTVEVLPKPVELPDKRWAQVVVMNTISGREFLVTRCDDSECWHDITGSTFPNEYVRKQYVRTISEGVDE